MNVSVLSDGETARTEPECAAQRAENLAILGVGSVLELCVGPSLRVLEAAYSTHGIVATGNDLEERWRRYYPEGRWEMGDCMEIDPRPYDAVVFAPPVTRGCTGHRIDSLRVSEVEPGYTRFLWSLQVWGFGGIGVLVLPARSIATSRDREETYGLLSVLGSYEMVPLHAERRRIRKYVDVYFDA
jgi:hypothetical protein